MQPENSNNLIIQSQTISKSKAKKRVRDTSPIIWNPLSQQLPKKPGRPRKVGTALQFE